MSTWAITCDRRRLRPGPDGGRYFEDGDELGGPEPRSDLAGDRPAQPELPVSRERGEDEPLRGRAPRLGGDPRPADRPGPEPGHWILPHHLLPRPGGRGHRGGGGTGDPDRGRGAGDPGEAARLAADGFATRSRPQAAAPHNRSGLRPSLRAVLPGGR